MDKRALIEKFHQMDKNCDGVLTANEIRICVQRSGLPESKVNEFLRLFDLSGDNVITLQEYICALGLQPPPPKDFVHYRNIYFASFCGQYSFPRKIHVIESVYNCIFNYTFY
ncbi:Calcium-binding protein [Schistosoma japonicum]|nr:Calcium-binding protein [Schistosoma japonicum]